jgi:hypothetical protein
MLAEHERALLFRISDMLFGRPGLSAAERVFMQVWWVEAEVNNGGFHQFYFNSAGNDAADTPAALEAIGAAKTAAIVRRANARFPGGEPPANRYARQGVLDQLDPDIRVFSDLDHEFYTGPEDLEALLYAFVIAHRAEIRGWA